MRTGESDTDLVMAAQGGDKEAFAVLLGRHRPLPVALCRRALADPVLSEDAAQEAILTALLNLDRLRHADRLGPWLAGIGLNVCRRLLRERSRDGWSWEVMHGGRQAHENSGSDPGPETLAEAADLAELTRNAIAILPPGQRAAVVHFYLAGLTHVETADLLGINVGTVKTRLHKARITLKRRLSDAETEREEAMDERLSRRTLAKTAAALTGTVAVGHTATPHAATNEVEHMTGEQGVTALVEMRVADIRRTHAENGRPRAHAVLLEEVNGTRRLPIWVGEAEGTTIAMQQEQVQVPRPPTITVAASLLQAGGAQVREVHIDRLVDSTFYATAIIEGNEGTSTVDARPSDAINLVLLAGVPIRVDQAILETSGPCADALDDTTEGAVEIVAKVMASWPHPVTPTSLHP